MIKCIKCKKEYPVYYSVYDKDNWVCHSCQNKGSLNLNKTNGGETDGKEIN